VSPANKFAKGRAGWRAASRSAMPNDADKPIGAEHPSAGVAPDLLESKRSNDRVTPALILIRPVPNTGPRRPEGGSCFRPTTDPRPPDWGRPMTPMAQSLRPSRSPRSSPLHYPSESSNDLPPRRRFDLASTQRPLAGEAAGVLLFFATSAETFVGQDKKNITCGAYRTEFIGLYGITALGGDMSDRSQCPGITRVFLITLTCGF
jgi:hypothetical protein